MSNLFQPQDRAPLQITLMGSFSCVGDAPCSFASRSAAKIIAYLALHLDQWVSRDELAEALWPGLDVANSRSNFRKSLQRARVAIPRADWIESNQDRLRLSSTHADTDLQQAKQLHRNFTFAPALPESIAHLAEEWKILRATFLPDWDDPWVESTRIDQSNRAHELGLELASAYESISQPDAAVRVLMQLFQSDPEQIDILVSALRLVSRTEGPRSALALYHKVLHLLPPRIELPDSLNKLVDRLRYREMEQISSPELFDSRNEWMLLSRLLESNIQSGAREAVELLAHESNNLAHWVHPRTLLEVVAKTLEITGVQSEAEITLASNACFLASYASDFDTGSWAAEKVLQVVPENDMRYVRALSMLGFLHFEAQGYDVARQHMDRALNLAKQHKIMIELPRIMNRCGVLESHTGQFDAARKLFHDAIRLETENARPNKQDLLASYFSNLCGLEVLAQNWDAAAIDGEKVFELTQNGAAIYRILTEAPLGLARVMKGDPSGIQLIIDGIRNTAREKMRRFNFMAVDFACVALQQLAPLSNPAFFSRTSCEIRSLTGFAQTPSEKQLLIAVLGPSAVLPDPAAKSVTLVDLSRAVVQELVACQSN